VNTSTFVAKCASEKVRSFIVHWADVHNQFRELLRTALAIIEHMYEHVQAMCKIFRRTCAAAALAHAGAALVHLSPL
jgi:hypothetical protein